MSTQLFAIHTHDMTVRKKNLNGETAVYENVEVIWEAERSGKYGAQSVESPVPSEEAITGEVDRDKKQFLDSLFTSKEAFWVLETLKEEKPEAKHLLEALSLPLPPFRVAPSKTGYLNEYGDSENGKTEILDVEGLEFPVVGLHHMRPATFVGIERHEDIYRRPRCELPVDVAEQLESMPNPSSYIRSLEENQAGATITPVEIDHLTGEIRKL